MERADEVRAIRQILMDRDAQRIMFVRMDDAAVKDTFRLDGAVDARHRRADEIARRSNSAWTSCARSPRSLSVPKAEFDKSHPINGRVGWL